MSNQPEPKGIPDLLTAKEVQTIFRIGRNTVYELARRRELEYVRIGSRMLFSRSAVEDFLRFSTVPAKRAFFKGHKSSHGQDSMRATS